MSELPFEIDDFARKLPRENDRKALAAVHERLTREGYKIQAKHNGAGFDIKYSIKSRKPIVAILYKKNKDADFEIHVRPLHVARYANRFCELSEHIRNCCINGRECGRCGYCDKAYVFEYEGITYVKCQFICANFCFTDIDEGDADSILRILDMELEEIASERKRKNPS